MKRYVFPRAMVFLAVCLLVGACSVPVEKTAVPQDPKMLYEKAVAQQAAGNTQGAYQTYVSVWKLFPYHRLAPEALFRAGELASTDNPQKASELYRAFLDSYGHSPLNPEAARNLLDVELRLGRHAKALALFEELFGRSRDPGLVRSGIRLVEELSGASRCSDALGLITLIFPSADKPSQDALLPWWKTCLEKSDQVDQLVNLEKDVHDDRLLNALLTREVDLYLAGGREDLARGVIPRLGPGTGFSPWADAASPEGRKTIGVIVPLSGKWESVGQKVLKGVQFASRVFSPEDTPPVDYLVRDYGDDEKSIPAIIEELDTSEDVVALIGPVGETAGSIACREARERGIPSLLFTRAESAPNQKSYCFSNFISIDIQCDALLKAALELNVPRFAILYPNDHFGSSFTRVFSEKAQGYGIGVVRSISYSSDLVDFKDAVQKLVEGLPEDGPPDFDALLIPDTAINSAMVASYLPYLNIQGVRLFGPTLWDSPDFIRVGGRYVENAVFVSGFFAGSRLEYVQEFNDQFYYTFGYNPSVWEASAYDTAMILQNLLNGGSPSREALQGLIGTLEGYPGLTGATSFSPDGSVRKLIYVLTVRNSSVYEIAP